MERETKAILDSIRCLGGEKGLIYVTVPITTGLREYVLMKELDCTRAELRSRFEDRWLTEVVGANEADAEAYARMIQLRNPGKLVLNPAPMNLAGWSQSEYTVMWNQVLVEFCDELVVTPDWPFSSGAIGEVEEMALLGREVVDVFGKRLSNQMLVDAAERARGTLVTMGFSDESLMNLLPKLSLPGRRSTAVRQFPGSEWDDALTWLLRETREIANMNHYDDDGKTRADGPHLDGGLWKERLDKYSFKAREIGVESPEGGIALAQFVTVGLALMESVWRIFGSFPEPGHPRGFIRMSRLPDPDDVDTGSLALVVAWLSREHAYTSSKYDLRDDDDHTRSSGTDEYWWRQLEWYFGLATREGLASSQGRQNLGKFVSTAMNFLVSRLRVFGPVGLPTRPPVTNLFS